MSSPYLRCLQTVEPLAESLGVVVEVRDELGYERHHLEGRALLASLAGVNAVVCGHGGLEAVVLGDAAPKWRKEQPSCSTTGSGSTRSLRPPARKHAGARERGLRRLSLRVVT